MKTDDNVSLDPGDIYFVTGSNDALAVSGWVLTPDDLRNIPASQYEVFEPLVEKPGVPIWLYVAHNNIHFYTWGDQECCLPRGATTATLKDKWVLPEEPEPTEQETNEKITYQQKTVKEEPEPTTPKRERKLHLKICDVLIFEEVIGPKTGNPADADPTHRHAVRLTEVKPGVDELCDQPILEVRWREEDALPFPLCISAIGPAPCCELFEDISVACGNVILVDHGKGVPDEPVGCVPTGKTTPQCCDDCYPPEVTIEPGKFNPQLKQQPLTFSQPLLRIEFSRRGRTL